MNAITFLPEKIIEQKNTHIYQFTQINSTDWAYLFEVRIDGVLAYYMVLKRKINKRFRCESYPTAKSFCKWAWTYTCLGKAIQRFKSL